MLGAEGPPVDDRAPTRISPPVDMIEAPRHFPAPDPAGFMHFR